MEEWLRIVVPLVQEFVLSVECCDIARYLRSPNDQAADVPYSHTSLQEVSCEIFTSF
jgi:phage gp36-like protein